MKNEALVYWVEAGSGELRLQRMTPNDLLGAGTYENEVRLKYAVNPIAMATIYLSRAGNDWERSEVARLKVLAEKIRTDHAAP